MFDHLLRGLKDRLLAPLASAIGTSVSPNAISLLALLFGLAAAAAAYLARDFAAVVLWLINRTLDGLDGTHARLNNMQSDFGGYLDIVLDFIVYAAIPSALILSPINGGIVAPGVFLLSTVMVNTASLMYLAAILEQRQAGALSRGELTTVTMPPGVVAGAETVVFFTLFLALASWRAALFWTMGVLVCVNIVQRLWWARRML